MSIRVTCPGCHQRFDVSEKFAGREGPCPKCKIKIRIPDKSEEVVIQTPDMAGPKDKKGRLVLKPIARAETILSGVQIALIVCTIVGFLLAALIVRFVLDGKEMPAYLPVLGNVLLAPAIVFAGYTFLRDQELGPFTGKQLWTRVAICSAVYAASWLAMYAGRYAFNDRWELGSWVSAIVSMLLLGAAAGMLAFEMDYLTGLLHYGLYLGCTFLMRVLAGMDVLPGMTEPTPLINANQQAKLGTLLQGCDFITDCILNFPCMIWL
jgi:hypothetical protein